MSTRHTHLIEGAKRLMRRSRDPMHDLAHAGRVMVHAKNIAERMSVQGGDMEAIMLAAWWHDVARTITKKPSLVWMSFIDDMVSACMFWFTARKDQKDPSVRLAIKLMLAKSLGTGSLFAYLLPPEKRYLIDIVKDADTLDVLNSARVENAMTLATNSRMYRFAYKRSIHWFIVNAKISMKTTEAREYFEELLRTLVAWMKKQTIFIWHVEQYGRAWVERIIDQCEQMITTMELARTRA